MFLLSFTCGTVPVFPGSLELVAPAALPEAEVERALRACRRTRPPVSEVVIEAMFEKAFEEGAARTPEQAYVWAVGPDSDRAEAKWRDDVYRHVADAVRKAGWNPHDPAADREIFMALQIGEDGLRGSLAYGSDQEPDYDEPVDDEDRGPDPYDEGYHAVWRQVLYRRPPITPPQSKSASNCGMRVHLGRAPRERHNHRRRGSRRASGVRQQPEDPGDGDPPGSLGLPPAWGQIAGAS